MTKVLVEVDESNHDAVCDRCNETFGQHTIWDCPDGKGRFSKFKEREVMTYNKETVVGVIEQIEKLEYPFTGGVPRWAIDVLLQNAKRGRYSEPTLEEVWKEKCEEAVKKKVYRFYFIYEDETYETSRVSVVWENPEKVLFL